MRLRNKKTGEIDDFIFEVITDRIDLYRRVGHSATKNIWHYNSLAELNEEWEDCKEPKEYWYIDVDGDVLCEPDDRSEFDNKCREIGNYFETKEEAERAVEKLKALKRLKDKGFKFGRWQFLDDRSGIWVRGNLVPGIVDELDIIFGGEE